MTKNTRQPTPVGWSDTDWLKHLEAQPHPLAGLHINQGSFDAAADAYEDEYNAAHNVECGTCSSTGTIDERLGGEWNSNPKAECPDCSGTGEAGHNVEVDRRHGQRAAIDARGSDAERLNSGDFAASSQSSPAMTG